jgi:beta-glucosidase
MKTMRIKLLVCALVATTGVVAQQFPYQNAALSPAERARDLVGRLTLEEKATLMCDVSDAVPRLGIKGFNWWSEALHGVANQDGITVFPEPIGMAASFNDALVQRVFDAVSDEMRAQHNERMRKGLPDKRFYGLSVWTPNVNIFRDPRWGRGQETYGEDPYLTSRMGCAVVRGLQGPEDAKYRKLLACAKHFAVHSGPEWSRHRLNLDNVSPRDLWETYLPAFKAVVQKADVREVMCAYQRLDDEPCCGNSRLLQQILRNDWGFQHMVVSDCGAIADFWTSHKVSSDGMHAGAKGALAGTDVECGNGSMYAFRKLPDAVRRGLIKETDINLHVQRLLEGRFELGDFDDPSLVPWTRLETSVINSKEHQQLALDMARQTLTLLQNRGNVLPLDARKCGRIAVIGPNADDKKLMWGNYNGQPVSTITILDGIRTKLPATDILYIKGCDLTEDKVTINCFDQCAMEGKKGIRATYWNNSDCTGEPVCSEQITQPIQLTTMGQHQFGPGVQLKGFSAKYETVLTPEASQALIFTIAATGSFELKVNGESLRRFDSWRPAPVKIPLQVEKGKTYTIELRFVQKFDFADASLNFNLGVETMVDYANLVEQLKGISTVIFAGGISSQLEGEEMPIAIPGFKGGDRTDIELPASQRRCLQALHAAGKRVIMVNCSGSCIALEPETHACDAILQAWYAGENGGQAIADVLFGDYNPAGHLPITFYKNSAQLPDFEEYSMKGRTYRYMSDALFPFGYGLSYTTFSIGKAKASTAMLNKTEPFTLQVPVTNKGRRDGTEIVQVYLRRSADTAGPIKSLRAFSRVDVPKGRTVTAQLVIQPSDFETFDESTNTMRVVPGDYDILYGTSSAPNDLQTLKLTIAD